MSARRHNMNELVDQIGGYLTAPPRQHDPRPDAMSPRSIHREMPGPAVHRDRAAAPPWAGTDPFDLVSLIVSERDPAPGMQSEHVKILRICQSPTAVVEISAELDMPVSVVKILLRDAPRQGQHHHSPRVLRHGRILIIAFGAQRAPASSRDRVRWDAPVPENAWRMVMLPLSRRIPPAEILTTLTGMSSSAEISTTAVGLWQMRRDLTCSDCILARIALADDERDQVEGVVPAQGGAAAGHGVQPVRHLSMGSTRAHGIRTGSCCLGGAVR